MLTRFKPLIQPGTIRANTFVHHSVEGSLLLRWSSPSGLESPSESACPPSSGGLNSMTQRCVQWPRSAKDHGRRPALPGRAAARRGDGAGCEAWVSVRLTPSASLAEQMFWPPRGANVLASSRTMASMPAPPSTLTQPRRRPLSSPRPSPCTCPRCSTRCSACTRPPCSPPPSPGSPPA